MLGVVLILGGVEGCCEGALRCGRWPRRVGPPSERLCAHEDDGPLTPKPGRWAKPDVPCGGAFSQLPRRDANKNPKP